MQIGELFGKLMMDTTNWNQGLKEGAGSTERFAENSKGFFGRITDSIFNIKNALMGYSAMVAGGSMYGWLIQGNAQMETFRGTLETTMKDTKKAADYLNWAMTFAAQTPFEIPQVVQATVKLSNYGLEAKKVLPMVGDMASVMGKSIDQAVEAIADAQTGELERLKEFGITKKMIQAELVKEGKNDIVNAKGQITDYAAFNAALFKIMEDRYKGGMERASHTFTGMMSNLKDWWGTLGRSLGAGIFDKIKAGLEVLLAKLNDLQSNGTIQKWVDKFSSGVGKVTDVLFGLFLLILGDGKKAKDQIDKVFGPGTTDFLVKLRDTIMGTITWVKDFFVKLNDWGLLKPIILGVVAAMAAFKVGLAISSMIMTYNKAMVAFREGKLLATAAQWLFNGAVAANPIVLIVGLIIGVVAALGFIIYKHWGEISAFLHKTWTAIKTVFTQTWDALSVWFNGWMTKLKVAITTVLTGISHFFSNTWTSIKNTAMAIWNGLLVGIKTVIMFYFNLYKTIIMTVVNAIIGAFKWLYDHNYYFQHLVDFILKVFNTVKEAIPKLWTELVNWLVNNWTWLKNTVVEIFTNISNWLNNNWTWLKNTLTDLWNAISAIAASVWHGLVNRIMSIVVPIIAWFSDVWGGIRNNLSGIWNGIANTASNVWHGIINGIRNIMGGAYDAVASPFNAIRNFFGDLFGEAWDWGSQVIKQIIGGIKSMAGAVGEEAKKIAGKIANFLGFHSPTEEGPGSESDKWMPNLMKMMIKGIDGGKDGIHAALNSVMSPVINPKLTNNISSKTNGSTGDYSVIPEKQGDEIIIKIDKLAVRTDDDIRKIAEKLAEYIKVKKRGVGIA